MVLGHSELEYFRPPVLTGFFSWDSFRNRGVLPLSPPPPKHFFGGLVFLGGPRNNFFFRGHLLLFYSPAFILGNFDLGFFGPFCEGFSLGGPL